jgi:transcriptional regulator with XRE-family HTH domain
MDDTVSLGDEFLRALRGARSQAGFSRRLGYRSNIVSEWEAGRRKPSASVVLDACRLAGIDVEAALHAFHAPTAALMRPSSRAAPIGGEQLLAWLRAQRGGLSGLEIAERTGFSRYKVSRIFSGRVRLAWPEFLSLVAATTGRLVEFVTAFVAVEKLPSVADEYTRLKLSRELAFTEPWSSAILALLETRDYTMLKQHDDAFLAERLRLDPGAVRRVLEQLLAAGILSEQSGKYRTRQTMTINTRAEPERARSLRSHWGSVALERVANPDSNDVFSYNVFSVSRERFEEIRELHLQYFRAVRALVAGDRDPDCVALVVVSLTQLA